MFSKLGIWKKKIAAVAALLGGPGLFLISFLDSSILTFPIINDFLLIDLSIQHPKRMAVYALLASLGSVLGCVLLYFIAKKGGEALFHRRTGQQGKAIRRWVERNGFGGMLLAALLPPPTPFKLFVLAGGVFEVPLGGFTSAIALARLLRYFGLGFLAVRYGHNAMPFLLSHKWQVIFFLAVFVAASYAASRAVLRPRIGEEPVPPPKD